MPEPTSCVGCCGRTGTYCDRRDLLVGLPGLHVIKVAAGAGWLPGVWGDRCQPWPAHRDVSRRAAFWPAGAGGVAEADLAMPRTGLLR
jgi:hypothetical protein